jgi:N-acetylmuramic acid 6-phosphate etherase
MKAGTAQKMTLNMLSTSVMIKLGHVLDNKMVDMHINNKKLEERAIKMIQNMCNLKKLEALELLKKHGSVRQVLNNI